MSTEKDKPSQPAPHRPSPSPPSRIERPQPNTNRPEKRERQDSGEKRNAIGHAPSTSRPSKKPTKKYRDSSTGRFEKSERPQPKTNRPVFRYRDDQNSSDSSK